MKILQNIGITLMVLVMVDLFILMAALGQIATEGRSGYWSPFWSTQAEFVLHPHL